MDCFANAAKHFRLTISLKKTEVMLQPRPGSSPPKPDVFVNNTPLNVVDKFCYRGSVLSQNAEISDDITRRISAAKRSIWQSRIAALEGTWCTPKYKSCSLQSCSHRYPAVRLRVVDHLSTACTQSRSVSHALPASHCYHVRQKTALFYFCNILIKPISILIIFGTHILQ